MNPESTHSYASIADMPEQSERFAGVYKVLQNAIATHAFPGCAFGVFAGGETVLEDALGRFTYETESPSVEPHTVFDVASITKVVSTTAAAMLLYQRGLLDLDMPLGELLPGFVVGRDSAKLARLVTLRHLLAHNSGLPGYVEFFRTVATPAELYRACLELPVEAVPGERSEYSDPGFILLGKALEVLTRENLAVWAQKEVFGPLGLTATLFSPSIAQRALIPPTEIDNTFRHRLIQGEVQDENAWILNGAAGHAGLFSNVADLLRFAAEILATSDNGSPQNASALFTSDTVDSFAMPQGPEGASRALGWDTRSKESSAGQYFSAHSIGHLGFSGCSLWIDLDASVTAVLLTNRTWPDRQTQLIREVRPAFHDAVRLALSDGQAL
ncbi:MAG TPA: serine hydrolase domain-containing protein [Terracidiphilus sp.]|nr:serine hydrolase domain-containing protein [Terracidiphilus sp.]